MTFDENGICVLSSITHPDECDAYIHFLGHESDRHFIGQRDALKWAEWHEKFPFTRPDFHRAMAKFYYSAVERHQQDIDGIERLIPKIEEYKAKLEGK